MGQQKTTQTTTQSGSQTQQPWLQDMWGNLINQQIGVGQQGYQPFTGQRYADPTQLMQQYWNQAAQGPQGSGYIGQAADMLGNVGNVRSIQGERGYTGIGNYMNPYTQNVVDTTMADLQRQRQITQQGIQDQATKAGAFGGSRHGIAEAETNRNFADIAAQTSGNLRQQGFNTAAGLAQQDANRQLQAGMANQQGDHWNQLAGLQGAQIMGSLGSQLGNLGLSHLAMLGNAAGTQQGMAQQPYDFNYGQFREARDWGQQQINNLAGLLGMFPGNTSWTNQTSQPMYRNRLGGMLGGAASGYAMGGGPWGAVLGGLGGLF